MKSEELRALDSEELGGRLRGARRELYELRFKLAVGQLDNHREIRKARKEIAQILTVVHQRRLGAVEGEFEDQSLPASRPEAGEEAAGAAAGPAESGPAEAGAVDAEAASEALETETAEEPAAEPAAAEPGAGEMTTEEEPAPEAGPTSTPRRGRKTSSEDQEA
jgi:large subunit ribosomal protein L29